MVLAWSLLFVPFAPLLCRIKSGVMKADAFICGDEAEAAYITIKLAGEIKSLRPQKADPLTLSSMVESLTPFLLNVFRKNKIKDAQIAFVSEREVRIK
jgi:predicted dinucleotide-binding enzyme